MVLQTFPSRVAITLLANWAHILKGIEPTWRTAAPSIKESICSSRTGPPSRNASTIFGAPAGSTPRSEEHTSELQSLMRISYAVVCLKTKRKEQLQMQTIQS